MVAALRLRRGILKARTLTLPDQGGGGGGSLTFTKSIDPATYTATPNGGAGTSTTFSTVPIGTAAADRYVVVCLHHDIVGSPSSVTIAGNAMTKLADSGSSASQGVQIYGYLLTTGSTATIVVNYANFSAYYVTISGGYITGSATIAVASGGGAPVTQDRTYGDFALGSITPPSTGAMVVAVTTDTNDIGSPSWSAGLASAATGYDYYSATHTRNYFMTYATSLGSALTPTLTGPGDDFMSGCAVAFQV